MQDSPCSLFSHNSGCSPHTCLKLSTVLLVDKDVSVSNITLVHLGDDLVDVVELSLLDPGVDLLLGGEFEHLGDQRGGALEECSGWRVNRRSEGTCDTSNSKLTIMLPPKETLPPINC